MTLGKSILLVTVDCLRADHVGFMGYTSGTSPFLDSLAAESIVVPTAIVAGAPTYYSLPAILVSRYPLALGRDVVGLAPGEATIASVLKQSGYATAAFTAGNPYISSRFGYNQGFDIFRDHLDGDAAAIANVTPVSIGHRLASRVNRKLQKWRKRMGPAGPLYDELYFRYCQRVTPSPSSLDALRRFPAADAIVSEACDWLKSIGDRPFFVWLHLMDPHAPYYPKDEAIRLLGRKTVAPAHARYLNSFWNRSDIGASRFESRRDEVVALYDAGLRWVDEQMLRLVEYLRSANRWDDCVFALTADHGEEFLEHGGRYHPPSDLREELIHVPLMLRIPGRARGPVSKSPFNLIDLAPTLLDSVGVTPPSDFIGSSCWPQLDQGGDFARPSISECVTGCTNPFRREARMGGRILAIRERRYKLVINCDLGADYLFDLEADPGEQSPLSAAAQKPVRRRLLEIAHEHLSQSVEKRDSDGRIRAQLRELELEWKRPAEKAAPVAC